MKNKQSLRRDRLQNALILLLSLSALCLFYLSQFGVPRFSSLQLLFSQTESDTDVTENSVFLREMDWPVTVLTADSFLSRRQLHLSTGDSRFTAAEALLEDAFREELTWADCDYADFRSAMDNDSLCILFPNTVPAEILFARLGLSVSSDFSVSRLLLSAVGDSVFLYSSDGISCRKSACAITKEALQEVISSLGGEICTLADETADIPSTLDPITPCSTELPVLSALSASTADAFSSPDTLLPQYGFNAHSTGRYTEADGTVVIVESPRRLRIRNNGTVDYLGTVKNAPEAFVLSSEGSLADITGLVFRLLKTMMDANNVTTPLYLSSVEAQEDTYTFEFVSMANGLSVVSSDGEPAAAVTLTSGVVTELSLRYRNYTASDSSAPLLPFPQALAIASDNSYRGMRMDLSYIDEGRDTLSAAWFMR